MENKCNKTPNNNNKYLDHVYCHTGASEGKNYIRVNNNNNNNSAGGGGANGSSADCMLLKENKHLKAMLILHLDLIVEQSEVVNAKDKQLTVLTEEIDKLRAKNVQLETQVQQLHRQIKRNAVSAGELSSLPPPPLAKIQCKTELVTAVPVSGGVGVTATTAAASAGGCSNATHGTGSAKAVMTSGTGTVGKTNIIGECNGKLISKIVLQRMKVTRRTRAIVGTSALSPHSTTASDSASEGPVEESTRDNPLRSFDLQINEETVKTEHMDAENDAADEDAEDYEDTMSHTTEESSDRAATPSKRHRRQKRATRACRTLNNTPTGSRPGSVQVCVTPPTPSRGKQMPLMLWHAPDMHTDESASCESLLDLTERLASVTSPLVAKEVSGTDDAKKYLCSHPPRTRKSAFLWTTEPYSTREWEDEEFNCDFEFIKEEADALKADEPMLEIPKWTEHELSASYSIEGTEDLSDETFLKRHGRLEVDERRRKKWDVQQIREQRRIEKLKRRHCKDEVQQTPSEQQPLLSFYPSAESIEAICYVNELPVQAFGEMIPRLPGAGECFKLPWLEAGIESTTTYAATKEDTAMTSLTTKNTTSALSQLVVSSSSTSSSSSSSSGGNIGPAGGGGGGSGNSCTVIWAGAGVELMVGCGASQLKSSFVFLKKRKRQQSASTGTSAAVSARQRSSTAAPPAPATVSAKSAQQLQTASSTTTATATTPAVAATPSTTVRATTTGSTSTSSASK